MFQYVCLGRKEGGKASGYSLFLIMDVRTLGRIIDLTDQGVVEDLIASDFAALFLPLVSMDVFICFRIGSMFL